MKDNAKISREFACDCGTTNKFEFETDFDLSSITIGVRCQHCGKDVTITLESFFRRNNGSSRPYSYSSSSPQQKVPLQRQWKAHSALSPPQISLPESQTNSTIPTSAPETTANETIEEEEDALSSQEEEEEISPEEEDALSSLFKSL